MAPRDPFDIAADLLDPPPDPYRDDPVGWANDVLGAHLWSAQREIVEAVRDHPRTAVRSGHGIGKTMVAAVAVLWFLDTHPSSRVVTTATKWSQVKNLLWHEIAQLHRRARRQPGRLDRPIFRADPLQVEFHLPDGRYALGVASRPGQSESFAGHHAPDILVVYDEASGVLPEIFEVGEGYMTTSGARMLLIGNPTRPTGELYDAFHSKRAEYHTIHISALDSPAITGEPVPEDVRDALTGLDWVESRRRAWGEESPIFQIRVLGNFARQAENTVCALGEVEAAQGRDLPPARPAQSRHAVVAIDVARFGSDETVIATRHSNRIRIRETYVGKATTDTVGRAVHWGRVLREEAGAEPIYVVDDDGVGGGVTDMLRERDLEVVAFNGGASAIESDSYPNRRSELWFTMQARLPSLDLDDDEQLAADLTAPQYKFDSQGRRVVERKAETKKRLGRSPDRGDAALLTLVPRPALAPQAIRTPPAPREDLATWDASPPRSGSLTGDLLHGDM